MALDTSRCEITNAIVQTDIERLSRLANALLAGKPAEIQSKAGYGELPVRA